jgi:hypothetical protein
VVVVILVAVVVVAANPKKATSRSIALAPVTAWGTVSLATTLSADRGTVVFSDNFRDQGSGWWITSLKDPTATATYAYGASSYVVAGRGDLLHNAYSPYSEPVSQLGTSMTATQSPDAPVVAGFGVTCRRGSAATAIKYEFLLEKDRQWEIARRDGSDLKVPARVIKQGTSSVSPGAAPNTVVGMCATQHDGRTTRLAMFLNGAPVADITDTAAALDGSGWLSGMVTSTRATKASTVTVSEFHQRTLDR